MCHNGLGFDLSGNFFGHLALRTMRERAEGLDGELEIVSAPDCGTQIIVAIPTCDGGAT